MKKEIGKRAPAARKSAARSAASKKTAAARKTASAPRTSRGTAKNLLTAGIKALGNAQTEAIARQSRMFESILGLNAGHDAPTGKPVNPLAAALDPFGFRKFEDVFDQRVARALINLGVPSAEAFAALTAEVERLRDRVSSLETQAKKR